MKPEEIKGIRKKFYLQDDGKTADDQCSLLSVGEVRALLSALEAARAEIKYQSDVNAALSKQSQEYWQDRENAAKLLESAQEENRRLREALGPLCEYVDGNEDILKDALEWDEGYALLTKAEQALARPEKEEV